MSDDGEQVERPMNFEGWWRCAICLFAHSTYETYCPTIKEDLQ